MFRTSVDSCRGVPVFESGKQKFEQKQSRNLDFYQNETIFESRNLDFSQIESSFETRYQNFPEFESGKGDDVACRAASPSPPCPSLCPPSPPWPSSPTSSTSWSSQTSQAGTSGADASHYRDERKTFLKTSSY